jgi:two-component system, cell cycle response regulator DivK
MSISFTSTHPLPPNPAPAGQLLVLDEIVKPPCLIKRTILIVEDDMFSFELMKYMLLETQANIIYAGNGEKAIEIIKSSNIDLVFLDLRLPLIDGYKVLSQVREFNKSLPIVAQTASVLTGDNIKIGEAGFTSSISKPFSRENLFRILNLYLPH